MTKEINKKQKTVYLEVELYNDLEKEHRSMSNLMVKILSEKMEGNK